MTELELTPGDVVVVRAFDDVPEHLFRVEEVFEDCVTGLPALMVWQSWTAPDCIQSPPE